MESGVLIANCASEAGVNWQFSRGKTPSCIWGLWGDVRQKIHVELMVFWFGGKVRWCIGGKEAYGA